MSPHRSGFCCGSPKAHILGLSSQIVSRQSPSAHLRLGGPHMLLKPEQVSGSPRHLHLQREGPGLIPPVQMLRKLPSSDAPAK